MCPHPNIYPHPIYIPPQSIAPVPLGGGSGHHGAGIPGPSEGGPGRAEPLALVRDRKRRPGSDVFHGDFTVFLFASVPAVAVDCCRQWTAMGSNRQQWTARPAGRAVMDADSGQHWMARDCDAWQCHAIGMMLAHAIPCHAMPCHAILCRAAACHGWQGRQWTAMRADVGKMPTRKRPNRYM